MSVTLRNASLQYVGLYDDTNIYELQSPQYNNKYYIISGQGTRRLMASPEVVGYESCSAMLPGHACPKELRKKGSWLSSAMISLTQIGWFGVGLAMFAIPVAKELLGLEVTPDHMPWQGYLLVLVAGVVLGAVVANLLHWGFPAINGMVVASICYLCGRFIEKK